MSVLPGETATRPLYIPLMDADGAVISLSAQLSAPPEA